MPTTAPDQAPSTAPDVPLSTATAHHVMQQHLGCPTAQCRNRQAALAVLVRARHYQLPASR
jgi:hypothetical protein